MSRLSNIEYAKELATRIYGKEALVKTRTSDSGRIDLAWVFTPEQQSVCAANTTWLLLQELRRRAKEKGLLSKQGPSGQTLHRLNVRGAARTLDISEASVRHLARQGKLRHEKRGKFFWFNGDEIREDFKKVTFYRRPGGRKVKPGDPHKRPHPSRANGKAEKEAFAPPSTKTSKRAPSGDPFEAFAETIGADADELRHRALDLLRAEIQSAIKKALR